MIVYKKNSNKKDEFKQILKVIISTVLSHKILLIISIIYSILNGYYFQSFVNNSNLNSTFKEDLIIGALLLLFKLTSRNIGNLLFLPFFNNSIMNMKKLFFKNSDQYNHGELQTALQKCESLQDCIKQLFSYIKKITSFLVTILFFFRKINNFFYFFIFLFVSILLFIGKQCLVIFFRRKAWKSSVLNRENSAKKILSNPYLIQGLFDLDEAYDFIQKEKNEWHIFYIVINVSTIIINTFYILFLIIFCKIENPIKIYFNLLSFLSFYQIIQSIVGSLDDIVKILKISEKKEEIYYKQLKLRNVKLKNKDITCLNELNFAMDEDIMVLSAPNGSGKSVFGRIIGKLIETEGEIQRPRTLYMNLDMHTLDPKTYTYSKGETVNYFIEKIVKNRDKNGEYYKLLILDEIFDVLNKHDENSLYYTILNKLLENNMKLIIITHSILDLDLTLAKTNNKIINYYTIKNKELKLITK